MESDLAVNIRLLKLNLYEKWHLKKLLQKINKKFEEIEF
jgi:hypothetical protein